MSDYMFMLESHLNGDHNRVVNAVTSLANEANVNLYLAGGAVRDMLGGFAIRDLDFTLETAAPKFAHKVVQQLGGEIRHEDPYHRFTELWLPGNVTSQIAIAREEQYSKPGGKPRVTAPVPIWGGSQAPRFHCRRHCSWTESRIARTTPRPQQRHRRPGE